MMARAIQPTDPRLRPARGYRFPGNGPCADVRLMTARPGRRQTPPTWRERLVPKTILGISTIVLAFAFGAALSGVSFYAYYEHRLDRNEKFDTDFRQNFGEEYENAKKTIEAETEQRPGGHPERARAAQEAAGRPRHASPTC